MGEDYCDIDGMVCCPPTDPKRREEVPAISLRMAVAGSEKKDAIQLVTVTVRTLNGL